MAILVKNLKKKVLENAKESDQIIIITGYFSPDMIDEIAKMGVPFVYYYGMYGIPGIDWNGNFDAKRFDYWMKTVKTWSRDNDRYEVAMHTVGSGLSYAELDEDKLPQTAVIEELNRVENEELRRGYYLGIINQRGVHWIDPEGKPELELAEDYENRANIAESRGYSRYAGILRVIGDEFKREAKSNILEAKNGDDE